MIDKFVQSVAEALASLNDGATVLLGGFGDVGTPSALLDGLIEQGAGDLTIVCTAGGRDGSAIAKLLLLGRVRKMICSFIRPASDAGRLFIAGKLDVEIVPQGTMAERLRAAGAGITGFYTPTAADTLLAEGREVREIEGKLCLLEYPLPGDVALVDAWESDRWGNLTYKDTQRNFNPVMATAATLTVAQAVHRVELGAIRPEDVHTPGIFVDRVLHVPEMLRAPEAA
jgi:3-oxoadipate CoA-transferase alpha subunit